MTSTATTQFHQRRKFFLILPLFVIPALFAAFYALGGGRDDKLQLPEKGPGMGFNMELPPPVFDKKEDKMDKMAFYKKVEDDSLRRKELRLQDPNYRSKSQRVAFIAEKPRSDTQGDALLQRLDRLKQRMDDQRSTGPVVKPRIPRHVENPVIQMRQPMFEVPKQADSPHVDPELETLNEMLDKIARLQQAGQAEEGTPAAEKNQGIKDQGNEHVCVTIPAEVNGDQELVPGATIGLRLSAAVEENGIVIPKGQPLYGVVSMNSDRMQVMIRSIRCGQFILPTAWQVYDMDGLQGIQIPDGLSRQVAKQSMDQSIGSLNLSTYDPSIGGQLAGAGIQTARNLFSRKVRTVRVRVPSGYRVLLQDMKAGSSMLRLIPDTVAGRARDSSAAAIEKILPPAVDSLRPFLHASVREGKVSLTLRGIYRGENIMWLYFVLKNKGPFDFYPDQLKCSICQGRHLKRMAVQELPVQIFFDSLPSVVSSGNEQMVMIGIKPFLLEKDKNLAVGLGTGLELKIGSHIWEKTEKL